MYVCNANSSCLSVPNASLFIFIVRFYHYESIAFILCEYFYQPNAFSASTAVFILLFYDSVRRFSNREECQFVQTAIIAHCPSLANTTFICTYIVAHILT